MKFKKLNINGFGKFSKKEIELYPGINLIYGKNEDGKSTLLKFIMSMLYGVSKNKNGKNISDFDKYKPWSLEEFSGSMNYELENGEEYEIFRDFKKKNPVIYNSEKEDISKSFKENKTKGIEFIEDQTGIDVDSYMSTAIISQEEVKLELGTQNAIIQKISNKISSGDDNISYKKSLAQIIKLQGEKVGTERTQNRPMNIVNSEISKLEVRKKELEELKEINQKNEEYIKELENKCFTEEKELELLQKLKDLEEENKIRFAEVDFIKNLEKENNQKIEELNIALESKKAKAKTNKKISKINYIVLAVFVIMAVATKFFTNIACIVCIVLAVLQLINVVIQIIKANIKQNVEFKNNSKDQEEILKQIDIIKSNNEEKSIEITTKLNKLNSEIDYKKDSIFEEYRNILNMEYIEKAFELKDEEFSKEYNLKQKNIEKLRKELHEAEFNKNAENKELEDLSGIIENLTNLNEEKYKLTSLNNSFNLAKEALEKAYEGIKKNISPKLTDNLCKTISKISDEKYKVVKTSDTDGLIVGLGNGSYVPVDRLSIGTIDQLYLSLRLSAITEMQKEKMPIILDETFAYFDDERLENILKYLSTEYGRHQIIILTCSKREEEAFKRLNIDYNSCILS